MKNTTQTMVAYLIVFEYDKYCFHEKCPISVGFFDYFFFQHAHFLAVTGKNTVHSNSFTIHRKKRHVLSPQRSFYVMQCECWDWALTGPQSWTKFHYCVPSPAAQHLAPCGLYVQGRTVSVCGGSHSTFTVNINSAVQIVDIVDNYIDTVDNA